MKLPAINSIFNYDIPAIKRLADRLSVCIGEERNPEEVLHRWYGYFAPDGPNPILRLQCKYYMRRKLMRLIAAEMLYEAQVSQEIGGDSGRSYASDRLVRFRKMQNEYNQTMLEQRCIIKNGKAVPLAKLVRSSEKRFAEMYVAVKGLEALAEERGYKWAMVTMTAPARFHPNPTNGRRTWDKQGAPNAKAAHQYLNNCWTALGRALKDYGIFMSNSDLFGHLVTEPHDDGCPHWHLLLFYPVHLEDRLFSRMQEEGGSVIGLFPRFFDHSPRAIDVSIGDPDRDNAASAASYASKYVMKALGIDDDDEVIDTTLTAEELAKKVAEKNKLEKIQAWRSATNIKSYRFVGVNASITKWRLFRTIQNWRNEGEIQLQFWVPTIFSNEVKVGEQARRPKNPWQKVYRQQAVIEEAICYATNNEFKEFVKAMGRIKDLGGLNILKRQEKNRYGELVKREYGLQVGHAVIIFNRHEVVDIPPDSLAEKVKHEGNNLKQEEVADQVDDNIPFIASELDAINEDAESVQPPPTPVGYPGVVHSYPRAPEAACGTSSAAQPVAAELPENACELEKMLWNAGLHVSQPQVEQIKQVKDKPAKRVDIKDDEGKGLLGFKLERAGYQENRCLFGDVDISTLPGYQDIQSEKLSEDA